MGGLCSLQVSAGWDSWRPSVTGDLSKLEQVSLMTDTLTTLRANRSCCRQLSHGDQDLGTLAELRAPTSWELEEKTKAV